MNVWWEKKKKSYCSTKCRKLEITEDVSLPTKIKDESQNEKLELSDKAYDFENNCLMLFKKGQYSINIRSVYEDLLCIGVVNVS